MAHAAVLSAHAAVFPVLHTDDVQSVEFASNGISVRSAVFVSTDFAFGYLTLICEQGGTIVTFFRGVRSGLFASGAVLLGLVSGSTLTYAAPVEVMLINDKTGKCLTVAGGTTSNNNHPIVQFDCDNHPSRRWRLTETRTDVFQIKNVKTGKCLTIAGGETPNNNHPSVQFNCDSHASRTWKIFDVTGTGVHQIRNVKTGKCVTIAGGETPNNNHPSVQFDCDSDASRRWTMRLKL